MSGIWREPAAETEDYPNLVVHDGRVTGSITVNRSRLPLWAIIRTAVEDGWREVESNWPQITVDCDFTASDLANFLHFLLEQRGEFARLLCILADVEWRDQVCAEKGSDGDSAWWEHAPSRARVIAQLRICLAALEAEEVSP